MIILTEWLCPFFLDRFIQSPLSDMKTQYTKGVEKADEQIQQLEKSQKYWERAAAEAQGNLKDILNGPRSM
jgi:prefoldin subunit 1